MFAVIAYLYSHFGPGVFVATLLVLMMLTPISFAPLLTVFGLYLLAVLGLSVFEISKQKFNPTLLLIPFIMIAIHFAYGIGTIKGWIFGFEFKKEYFAQKINLKNSYKYSWIQANLWYNKTDCIVIGVEWMRVNEEKNFE